MADETMMPAPSKVEKVKERMRNKQGLASPKDPVKSSVLGAPLPPAMVKHTCGHEAPFQEIARNERFQKELKRSCPACREANKEANQKAQEESRAKKKALSFGHYSDPGTGVGYSFIFHHLGVAQWEYSLVKMSSSQEVGKGTCKSLRMGIAAMNEILAKLEQQVATEECNMKLIFRGWLTDHGLNRAEIHGEMESEQRGATVLYWRGRFLWSEAHPFGLDEQYHLDINDGSFYEIMITDAQPPLVKFKTIS